jgi:nicotinamide phosphoribosyltransferase
MIQDVYPSGLVSVVSDTWDLWNVLTETLPSLRDEILGRDGKLVIRPDSGNPVDIVCGTREYRSQLTDPVAKGVVELLWDTFGGSINEQGYRVLDPHIGCIYGDGISPERAEAICERLKRKGFASTNIVFGVGSYTYQRVTRDTYGFAMKSTWVKINGEEKQIFKDPATDTGHVKRSLKGRVAVVGLGAGLVAFDGLTEAEEARIQSELRTVFEDGVVYNTQSLSDIRGRLAA